MGEPTELPMPLSKVGKVDRAVVRKVGKASRSVEVGGSLRGLSALFDRLEAAQDREVEVRRQLLDAVRADGPLAAADAHLADMADRHPAETHEPMPLYNEDGPPERWICKVWSPGLAERVCELWEWDGGTQG